MVVQRQDGWHVVSEDGSKHLGGPYASRGDAEERLKQIEEHKHMSFSPSGEGGLHTVGEMKTKEYSRNVFSVNAWCFSMSPGVGKWDRFTSWGSKVKDGQESVFNQETLSQMVQNFADRENDLAMCYDHQSAYVTDNGQPAPALAWYSALALVVDGKVVKFASHDDSIAAPDASELENGVYGFRAEVTPLGEKLLPNYRYISPMFTDQGADEEGNPIGYDLLDVAATNTPFQDAVGLTFHRMETKNNFKMGNTTGAAKRFSQEKTMDQDMMAKLGLADGCSADEMKGAMAKYMQNMEEKLKKFEEKKKEEPEKMAEEEPAKKAEEPEKMAEEDGDGDKDEKKAMSKLAKELGLPEGSTASECLMAVRVTRAPKTELAKLQGEIAELKKAEQARVEETKKAKAYSLADAAIKLGKISKEQREEIFEYAYARPEQAQKFVDGLPVIHATEANVTQRFTKGGSPVGGKRAELEPASVSGFEVRGAEFAGKARAYAKEKGIPLKQAQIAVLKLHPELKSDL